MTTLFQTAIFSVGLVIVDRLLKFQTRLTVDKSTDFRETYLESFPKQKIVRDILNFIESYRHLLSEFFVEFQ